MITTLTDAPLLRVRVVISELSGLAKDSDIMIDKLTSVRRSNVQDRVGRIAAEQFADVERCLMIFPGLAR